jgi:hypothetical protein
MSANDELMYKFSGYTAEGAMWGHPMTPYHGGAPVATMDDPAYNFADAQARGEKDLQKPKERPLAKIVS